MGDGECLLLTVTARLLKPAWGERCQLLEKHFCCSQLLSTGKPGKCCREGELPSQERKEEKPEWAWVNCRAGVGITHVGMSVTVRALRDSTCLLAENTKHIYHWQRWILLEKFTLMAFKGQGQHLFTMSWSSGQTRYMFSEQLLKITKIWFYLHYQIYKLKFLLYSLLTKMQRKGHSCMLLVEV